MTEQTLAQCLAAVGNAHDDALKAAATLYPTGTRVGVMLSSRQITPSPATIRGHAVHTWNFGDGTSACVQIRVEMDAYNSRRSRFATVSPNALRAA